MLLVYKSFVRHNLVYADVNLWQTFDESFKKNLVWFSINKDVAALMIAGPIKGASCDRLYQWLRIFSWQEKVQRVFFPTKLHWESYRLIFKLGWMPISARIKNVWGFFFCILYLCNEVNSTTKLEIYNQSVNLK